MRRVAEREPSSTPNADEAAVYAACAQHADAISCGNALVIHRLAFSMTDRLRPNKREAIRHFMWQAALTVVVNPAAATAMGDAHEGDDSSVDSQRDRINNAVAREWAEPCRRTLMSAASGGTPNLMAHLYREGEQLWSSGHLASTRRAADGERRLVPAKRTYP